MTYLQSLRRNSGECSPRDALPRLPENQWGNSPSLLQRNGRESPQEGAVLLLLLPKSFFPKKGERRGEDFGTEGTLSIGPFQQGEWAGTSCFLSGETVGAFLWLLHRNVSRILRHSFHARCFHRKIGPTETLAEVFLHSLHP